MRLRVLLVDVDSPWFNLALMKLSTTHKLQGDQVFLFRPKQLRWLGIGHPKNLGLSAPTGSYDKVYVSCIFPKNRQKALAIAKIYSMLGVADVDVGGSGVDLAKRLPADVEHIMPDYQLYRLNFSVGFLTRGCIRNCPWCIVPKKEGGIRTHSPLTEFLHPKHRKVMLLDNNLLAHPNHKEFLMELIERRLEVCFTQGLDIRLINDENAKLLRWVRYKNPKFNRSKLYFSWDDLHIEKMVFRGIEILRNHGIPPSHLRFYILCGFQVEPAEYTWDYFLRNDWYRYEALAKLGVDPYVMPYNYRKDIPLLTDFARWVNFAHKAKRKSLGLLGSLKTYLKDYHHCRKLRRRKNK